jgi:formylglycine-generating enzyme required for sulfatase activity/beta-lactamase regulating signal transducer with metallopeptidase domain
MTDLLNVFSSSVMERLGWTLLHSLWQFTLIAVVLGVVLALIPRRAANVRYLTACVALLAMLIVGATTYGLLPAPAPSPEVEVIASITVEEPVEVEPDLVEPEPMIDLYPTFNPEAYPSMFPLGPLPEVETSAPVPASPVVVAEREEPVISETPPEEAEEDAVAPWISGLSIVWILGVFVLSIRNIGGGCVAFGLRRRGTEPLPELIAERIAVLAQKMGFRRSILGRLSSRIDVPSVVGAVRPVILLPVSLATGVPAAQLDAMLAHELAHIRRYDFLINMLQRAAETLLFYHPAVWWTSRCIRREREHACDDLAVRVCGDSAPLAEALAAMAASRLPTQAALGASGPRSSSTLQRVRRLLNVKSESIGPAKIAASVLSLALLVTAVAVGAGLFVTEPNTAEAKNTVDLLDLSEDENDTEEDDDVSIASLEDQDPELAALRVIFDIPGAQQGNELLPAGSDESRFVLEDPDQRADGRYVRPEIVGDFTVGNPGEFTLKNIEPGEYRFRRMDRGVSFMQDVELEAGEVKTIRLVRSRGQQVAGRIEGLPGNVRKVSIDVFPREASDDPMVFRGLVKPHESSDKLECEYFGTFKTSVLEPGEYWLVAHGLMDPHDYDMMQPSGVDVLINRLRLTPGYPYNGYLGTMIGTAVVTVEDDDPKNPTKSTPEVVIEIGPYTGGGEPIVGVQVQAGSKRGVWGPENGSPTIDVEVNLENEQAYLGAGLSDVLVNPSPNSFSLEIDGERYDTTTEYLGRGFPLYQPNRDEPAAFNEQRPLSSMLKQTLTLDDQWVRNSPNYDPVNDKLSLLPGKHKVRVLFNGLEQDVPIASPWFVLEIVPELQEPDEEVAALPDQNPRFAALRVIVDVPGALHENEEPEPRSIGMGESWTKSDVRIGLDRIEGEMGIGTNEGVGPMRTSYSFYARNSGEFILRNVEPGEYDFRREKWLWLHEDDRGGGTYLDRQKLDMKPGEMKTVHVVRSRGQYAEGRIQGLPETVSGVRIFVRPVEASGDPRADRGEEGKLPYYDTLICEYDDQFRTSMLEPGEYRIVAHAYEARTTSSIFVAGYHLPEYFGTAVVTIEDDDPTNPTKPAPSVVIDMSPRGDWGEHVDGMQVRAQPLGQVWSPEEGPPKVAVEVEIWDPGRFENAGLAEKKMRHVPDSFSLEIDGVRYDFNTMHLVGFVPLIQPFKLELLLDDNWSRNSPSTDPNDTLSLEPGKHTVRILFIGLEQDPPPASREFEIEILAEDTVEDAVVDEIASIEDQDPELAALRVIVDIPGAVQGNESVLYRPGSGAPSMQMAGEDSHFTLQLRTWDIPDYNGNRDVGQQFAVGNPGEILLKNIQPGPYDFRREKMYNFDRSGRSSFLDRQNLELEPGEVTTVRLVRDRGQQVTGRVVGLPETVAGVTLSVRPVEASGDPRSPGDEWKLPIFDSLICAVRPSIVHDPVGPGLPPLVEYVGQGSPEFTTSVLEPGEYRIVAHGWEPEPEEQRYMSGVRLPEYVGTVIVTVEDDDPSDPTKPMPEVEVELLPYGMFGSPRDGVKVKAQATKCSYALGETPTLNVVVEIDDREAFEEAGFADKAMWHVPEAFAIEIDGVRYDCGRMHSVWPVPLMSPFESELELHEDWFANIKESSPFDPEDRLQLEPGLHRVRVIFTGLEQDDEPMSWSTVFTVEEEKEVISQGDWGEAVDGVHVRATSSQAVWSPEDGTPTVEVEVQVSDQETYEAVGLDGSLVYPTPNSFALEVDGVRLNTTIDYMGRGRPLYVPPESERNPGDQWPLDPTLKLELTLDDQWISVLSYYDSQHSRVPLKPGKHKIRVLFTGLEQDILPASREFEIEIETTEEAVESTEDVSEFSSIEGQDVELAALRVVFDIPGAKQGREELPAAVTSPESDYSNLLEAESRFVLGLPRSADRNVIEVTRSNVVLEPGGAVHSFRLGNPGELILKNVVPGQYELWREKYHPTCGFLPWNSEFDRQNIELEAGELRTVHVVRLRGQQVQGRIEGVPDRIPYVNLIVLPQAATTASLSWIEMRSHGEYSFRDVLISEPGGRFTTSLLEPGEYRIVAYAEERCLQNIGGEGRLPEYIGAIDIMIEDDDPKNPKKPVPEVIIDMNRAEWGDSVDGVRIKASSKPGLRESQDALPISKPMERIVWSPEDGTPTIDLEAEVSDLDVFQAAGLGEVKFGPSRTCCYALEVDGERYDGNQLGILFIDGGPLPKPVHVELKLNRLNWIRNGDLQDGLTLEPGIHTIRVLYVGLSQDPPPASREFEIEIVGDEADDVSSGDEIGDRHVAGSEPVPFSSPPPAIALVRLLGHENATPLGRESDGPKRRIIFSEDDRFDAMRPDQYTLDGLILDETPLLTDEDIVAYAWTPHVVQLKSGVRERLQQEIKPSVWGVPFAIVVEGEPVYVGCFWTGASSYMANMPTICLDPWYWHLAEGEPEITFDDWLQSRPDDVPDFLPQDAIRIENRYLIEEGEEPTDPRDVPELRSTLERLGKFQDVVERGFEAEDELDWGEAIEGVQFHIRTPDSSWGVGEGVVLQADFRNLGEKDRRIDLEHESWELEIDGQWHSPNASVSGVRRSLPLAAGETQHDLDVWNWLWENITEAVYDLPSGRHTLRVARTLPYVGVPPRGPALRVISNPVEIEIVSLEDIPWGDPHAGMRIRLRPSPDSTPEEPALHLDVWNVGDESITLGWPYLQSSWIEVDGQWYARLTTINGDVPIDQEFTLEPGQKHHALDTLRFSPYEQRQWLGGYTRTDGLVPSPTTHETRPPARLLDVTPGVHQVRLALPVVYPHEPMRAEYAYSHEEEVEIEEVEVDEPPLLEPGQRRTITINDVDFYFRWCPPGAFTMGWPDDVIAKWDETDVRDELDMYFDSSDAYVRSHPVVLTQGFWMLETETTIEQYYEVTGLNPSHWTQVARDTAGLNVGVRHPVHSVSWTDANKFCEQMTQLLDEDLQVCLPNEAQWEYACRAGTDQLRVGDIDDIAWHLGNTEILEGPGSVGGGSNGPRRVATKESNPWGLYDMMGNVEEWCADWYGPYGPYPMFSVVNPLGASEGEKRVVRGCSYEDDGRFQDPQEMRYGFHATERDQMRPESEEDRKQYAYRTVGFRVVLSPSPKNDDVAIEFPEEELALDLPLSDLTLQELEIEEIENGRARNSNNNGLTTSVIGDGLEWIVEHQLPSGGWSFDLDECPSCEGQCGDSGQHVEDKNAATGLALLALLGAGHWPNQARGLGPDYSENVASGLQFLMNNMEKTPHGGNFSMSSSGGYAQGICTLALCEAYAVTQDPDMKTAALDALQYVEYAQDPVGGGWRYYPRQPGDASVTAWQILALTSARKAGLDVDDQIFRRAMEFLDTVQTDGGAKYGYTLGNVERPGTTAMGLLSRMHLGWERDNPNLLRGANWLLDDKRNAFDLSGSYFAAQLFHQIDVVHLIEFDRENCSMFCESQASEGHERGSWMFESPHSNYGGRLYCTSITLMRMEIWYRHLSIYRAEIADNEPESWEISKLYDPTFLRHHLRDHEALPEPIVVPAVRGVVVDPSGRSVPNVQIVSHTPRHVVQFSEDGMLKPFQHGPVTSADDKGGFAIPERKEPYRVLVAHETGVASVSHEELINADGRITLQPWARIEGVFTLEGVPQPNVPIMIYPDTLPWSYSKGGPRVQANRYSAATTDEDGRFAIEKLLPLSGQIYTNAGARSNGRRFACNPGETTQIELGVGRTVTGRLCTSNYNADPSGDENISIDWEGTISAHPTPLPIPWPDHIPETDTDARTQWHEEWRRTSAGQLVLDENHIRINLRYRGQVDSDGSFRIQGLPVGEYVARVYPADEQRFAPFDFFVDFEDGSPIFLDARLVPISSE